MKKIFSFWVLCLMAFATSALVSCSSDDNGDEWGGFKFENVRDGKLSVAANQTSSEIIMKASKAYRAYVSATSDGSSTEEISWLHYEGSRLDDGTCYINIQLDKNDTGKSRSAYIIIVCDDKTVPILITQTTENTPNVGGDSDADNGGITALFTITKECSVITGTHVEDDGTETYELQYQNGNLTRFKHVERDDMAGASDKYCIETTTGTFFNSGTSIKTDWNRKFIYYPSQKTEEDVADFNAKLENGRVVSGTIFKSWMKGTRPFEISYNTDGTLKQTRYNDISEYDGSDGWDNHTFIWENGYLTKVKCESMDAVSTFAYDKTIAIPAPFDKALDLNMLLLLEEAEFFDATNGQILNVLAVGGKLGTRSKGLIKEYHCDLPEPDAPFTLKMTYKKLTSDEVIVEVNHYENNQLRFGYKWTIKRS